MLLEQCGDEAGIKGIAGAGAALVVRVVGADAQFHLFVHQMGAPIPLRDHHGPAAGGRTVVITEGNRGAHLVNEQMKLRVGAYDTDYQGGTGAGDAFDAGFIAALLQEHDLPTCLRWGSALGASCVRSTSATGSVFNRDEALKFMESHPITVERC